MIDYDDLMDIWSKVKDGLAPADVLLACVGNFYVCCPWELKEISNVEN